MTEDKDFLEWARESYLAISKGDTEATYIYYLPWINDSENDWAIVMAAVDESEIPIGLKSIGIYIKIAYQSKNSYMQEYGMDWEWPFDPICGEIDDSCEMYLGNVGEDPISDHEKYLLYLWDEARRYYKPIKDIIYTKRSEGGTK